MSSRWELMRHRDLERLQEAAATEDRALEEQREAQARRNEERGAEKVCKFAGAEPGESLKIIQACILGLMGLPRGTLHMTEPGALGLHSRKSSSRMMIHKLAAT